MQTESTIPLGLNGKAAASVATAEDELADFSTNRRVLLLSAMALAIGAISSLVAYALIWLIAAITNLAFYQRLSAIPTIPQGHHLGLWVVLVPVSMCNQFVLLKASHETARFPQFFQDQEPQAGFVRGDLRRRSVAVQCAAWQVRQQR
jgi:hypothetical protein